MSLFYTALQSARYSPKPLSPDMSVPEYLAQVTVGVENAEERINIGKGSLMHLLSTGSMSDLAKYLPVYGEFFGYIF